MPQIPRSTRRVQRQVARGNPGQANIDPNAFGDFSGRNFRARQQFLNAVTNQGIRLTKKGIQEKERQEKNMDDLALKAAETEVINFAINSEYSKDGFRFKRGADASGLEDSISLSYDEKIAEIGKRFQGKEDLSARFKLYTDNKKLQLLGKVKAHVGKESFEYQNKVIKDKQNALVSQALANPFDENTIEESIIESRALIDERGELDGRETPESLAMAKALVESQIRSGVTKRLIDNNQFNAANAYFNKYRANLLPEDHDQLSPLVQQGEKEVFAQNAVESVLSQHKTEKEAIDAAREKYQGKQEDQIIQRIRFRFSEERRFEKQRVTNERASVREWIDSGKPFSDYPKSNLINFSASEIRKFEKYEQEEIRNRKEPVTQYNFYNNLKQMAIDPKTREKFKSLDFNKIKFDRKLDNKDFNELASLQQKMISGDKEANNKVSNLFKFDRVIREQMQSLGIRAYNFEKDDTKLKDEASEIIRQVHEVMEDKGLSNLDVATVKKITRDIVSGEVRLPNSFFGKFLNSQYKSSIFGFNDDSVQVATKKVKINELTLEDIPNISIRIKDLPESEVIYLRQELNRKGMPVTENNMATIYRDRISRMVRATGGRRDNL